MGMSSVQTAGKESASHEICTLRNVTGVMYQDKMQRRKNIHN